MKENPNDWSLEEVLEWLRTSPLSYYKMSQITGMSAVMVSAYAQGKAIPKRESCAQMARGIIEYEKTRSFKAPTLPQPNTRENPANATATLAALASSLQYDNQRNREELAQLTSRVSDCLRAVLMILDAAKKDPTILNHIPDFDLEF